MESNTDIQCIVDQFKNQIFSIAEEISRSKKKERFRLLHKMNSLMKILFMIEDIDQSAENFLQEQIQKRTPDNTLTSVEVEVREKV